MHDLGRAIFETDRMVGEAESAEHREFLEVLGGLLRGENAPRRTPRQEHEVGGASGGTARPSAGPAGLGSRAAQALAGGERNENTLTDLVFFERHPERGGRSIQTNEYDLASEWLQIRDTLVRPALQAAPAGAPSGAYPGVPAGVSYFDGKPCANWLIPYLRWAREHGWPGKLLSGWRNPEASEKICLDRCGAPTCKTPYIPCAGRSSKHSAYVKPNGAIDVSESSRFRELMAQCPLSPPIYNKVTNDPNHFSASGY